MNRNWFEKFSGFLLDLAKIVFTALIIGKILSPDIDWLMFWGGIMLMFVLVSGSLLVSGWKSEARV